LYTEVPRSFNHSNLKLETTQLSCYDWTIEWTGVHPYHDVVFSNKKEKNKWCMWHTYSPLSSPLPHITSHHITCTAVVHAMLVTLELAVWISAISGSCFVGVFSMHFLQLPLNLLIFQNRKL
jgi:hypothetical protein